MIKIPICGRKGAGKFALIDDSDYEAVNRFKWYLKWNGYAIRYVWDGAKASTVCMHRDLMETPAGMDTDHVNHDKLDNRRENLRVCTRSENNMNKAKPAEFKHSKYKGVSFTVNYGRGTKGRKYYYWKAIVKVNGKRYSANAINEEDAARKYNELAKQHHGEYALLNEV